MNLTSTSTVFGLGTHPEAREPLARTSEGTFTLASWTWFHGVEYPSQDLHEEETLNRVRFQLVMVERQVDRLSGYIGEDATAKLEAVAGKLQLALTAAESDVELLKRQLKGSHGDLGGDSPATWPDKMHSQNLPICGL